MTLASAQTNICPQSAPGEERPMVKWDVTLSEEGGVPILEQWEARYRFEGVDATALKTLIETSRGFLGLEEIPGKTGLSLDEVRDILDNLYACNLAVDLEKCNDERIAPETFAAICRDTFLQWKDRLFSHSLWRGLATGSASKTTFLGWLLEHYHYIEGANDRMSLAVAACDIMTAREHIAHHYTEEYDHGLFLLKCLRAYGYTNEWVHNTRPLPSTISMLNYMRHCGRQGALNYAICSGFLESSGKERDRAQLFLDALTEHYAQDAPNAIKPLEAHAQVDADLGHGNLLEEVLESIGPITQAQATEALCAGFGLVEILERWSTDIERTYRDASSLERTALPIYRPVTPKNETEA